MPSIIIPPHKVSPPSDPQQPLAVSVREAARLLGVSERSLRSWSRQGKIRARRIGSRILFSVKELEAFLAADSDNAEKKNQGAARCASDSMQN